jgi:hypothetical protein
MRIECYLFVAYQGQYRFGFDVFKENNHYKISEVLESKRGYDHFWDVTMRGRPTLHELTEETLRVRVLRGEWERFIRSELQVHIERITRNCNARIQRDGGKGVYVDYIRVE